MQLAGTGEMERFASRRHTPPREATPLVGICVNRMRTNLVSSMLDHDMRQSLSESRLMVVI